MLPSWTRVWSPVGVPAGTVKETVTVPFGSAVNVPMVCGVECRVTVTTSPGLKPVRTLTTLRPGAALSPVAEPPSGLATPLVLAWVPRISPVGVLFGASVVGVSVGVGGVDAGAPFRVTLVFGYTN